VLRAEARAPTEPEEAQDPGTGLADSRARQPHKFIKHYQKICDRLLKPDAGHILSKNTFPKGRPLHRQKGDDGSDEVE
jgi:hypothetical protein